MYNYIMNRIKEIRTMRGIKQIDLCKQLGITQGALSGWETGRYQPDISALKKMSEIFGVSVDYLIGSKDSSMEAILGKPSPGAVRIPVLGRVAGGIPLYTLEEIIDWEEIPETMAHGEEYFGLSIKGHSMEPRICDGDVVIVRRQQTCENGAIAIVLINGDAATCKRVKFTDHGISLISSNPEFEPLFYTKKEIAELPVEIIGVVVELRGKFNY